MKLHDMKLTKEETKEIAGMMPTDISKSKDKGPKYSYSTRLFLEQSELEKLGLDLTKIKVGQTVRVMAEATVDSINISESEMGGKRQSCSMQITKMAVDPSGKGNKAYREWRKDGGGIPE